MPLVGQFKIENLLEKMCSHSSFLHIIANMENHNSCCAVVNFSQFIMAFHTHASIVSDGTGLDIVHLVKQLGQCQIAILMGRG